MAKRVDLEPAPGSVASKRKVSLYTFASGAYIEAAHVFLQEAEKTGWFSSVSVYGEADLPPDVRNYCQKTAHISRGFGFYIWKPVIAHLVTSTLKEGELAVYLDVGFALNPKATPRFEEYLSLVEQESPHVLAWQLNPNPEIPFEEFNNSKRAVPEALGLQMDSPHMVSGAIMAGAHILKKCSASVAIIEQWYRTCVSKPDLLLEVSATPEAEHPSFKVNRNDQPIFSLVCKMAKALTVDANEILPELHGYNGVAEMSDFPFWAIRRRSALVLRGNRNT